MLLLTRQLCNQAVMLVTDEIARLNGVISTEECFNKGREPSQLYSYNAQITDYYARGKYFLARTLTKFRVSFQLLLISRREERFR